MERCYTLDNKLVIPDTIEGLPVTELDNIYIFPNCAKAGAAGSRTGKESRKVCGEVLEELTLPEHLEKVGAYAFYNCFHLKKLSCCSTVKDWGAGVFTGCTRITELDIRIFPEAKSSFKEILSELRQMLVVDYRDEQGKLLAKLIFPEFFEESIENTPARIIMREMHGCGHMYRYCFSGTDFQFWEYDKLLPTAEILESPVLVCRMAIYRLYWPKGLTEEWKEEYWKYIKKHPEEAAKGLAERGKGEILAWLAQKKETDVRMIEQMIQAAAGLGDAQVSAILMDARHKKMGAQAGINRSKSPNFRVIAFNGSWSRFFRFSGKYISMFLSALRRLSNT